MIAGFFEVRAAPGKRCYRKCGGTLCDIVVSDRKRVLDLRVDELYSVGGTWRYRWIHIDRGAHASVCDAFFQKCAVGVAADLQ